MPILRKYVTPLDCDLKDHEIMAYGRELASVTGAIVTETANQASLKQEMKARLAGLEARASELSAKINRGKEIRDVQVEVSANFEQGIASETRTDTGEVIRERHLREDEKQPVLPGVKGEDSPDRTSASEEAVPPEVVAHPEAAQQTEGVQP